MSYRKYLNDYSIETYTDVKGKVRTRAVYIAGDYVLSPAISGKNKHIILAASLLSWIALLGALVLRTGASKLAYVILPFTFSALPLYLFTEAAVMLIRERELLTRDRAEKIANRLPLCPLIASVLSGAAFIGLVLTAFIEMEGMLSSNILFGALSLVATAAESVAYSKCRGLKAHKYNPD